MNIVESLAEEAYDAWHSWDWSDPVTDEPLPQWGNLDKKYKWAWEAVVRQIASRISRDIESDYC